MQPEMESQKKWAHHVFQVQVPPRVGSLPMVLYQDVLRAKGFKIRGRVMGKSTQGLASIGWKVRLEVGQGMEERCQVPLIPAQNVPNPVQAPGQER